MIVLSNSEFYNVLLTFCALLSSVCGQHTGEAIHSQRPAVTFKLKSVHHRGLGDQYKVHKRLDIRSSTWQEQSVHDSLVQPYRINRLGRDKVITLKEHSSQALSTFQYGQNTQSQQVFAPTAKPDYNSMWVEKEIMLPNVSDRGVVLALAAMTSNCYTELPHTGDWIDVDDPYNSTGSFGWDSNGLRGHVFANEDNSSVVIAYKGTSLVGDTSRLDKRMDNLLFSCCCARVSYLWRTVCDCYEDTFQCNMTCLEDNLRSKKGYYRAGLDVYHNVTSMYPKANIWLVGHSLGGAVASLVAQTYALPAVTFQAPGERLAAKRLGLPIRPKSLHVSPDLFQVTKDHHPEPDPKEDFAKNIWAFGHTADPLFMGTCGGITSLCWSAGFAMETHCHSGLECVYDVVNDLGWRQGVNTHRILTVINDVIPKYNITPTCVRTDDCVDCFNWNG